MAAPIPNTHAYGHCDLAAEEHLVADQPEPGAELIIQYPGSALLGDTPELPDASNSLAH